MWFKQARNIKNAFLLLFVLGNYQLKPNQQIHKFRQKVALTASAISLCGFGLYQAYQKSNLNKKLESIKQSFSIKLDIYGIHNDAFLKAVKEGDLDLVKDWIKKGININGRGYLGYTALIHAAVKGHLPILQELLKNGASI